MALVLFQNVPKCKVFFFIVCLCISWISFVSSQSQCFLSDGQCMYNVQLSHSDGKCNSDQRAPPVLTETQNDNFKKMSNIEKDFYDVKEEHENRLKHLETAVQKVVLGALDSVPLNLDDNKLNLKLASKYSVGNVETEERLLSQLHKEFKVIREKLRMKSEILIATEIKLNDTLRALEQSQDSFLQTNRDLLSAEDKVGLLQEENFDMKINLEDKTERLRVLTTRLNETEESLKILTADYEITAQSERYLKVQLENHKDALNETTILLDKVSTDYNELIEKHTKTVETLKKRESELIECYTAKTATFCGFEDFNICGFSQENGTDFFNWTRARGKTPSSNTGPDSDHTCGGPNGHFMYIEASSRGRGQNAILYSPKYRSLNEQCLEFYYHMYGRNVGTLNVYTKAFGNEVASVWRAYGNQGNFWIVSRLYIPEALARVGYQVGFEAITETGFQGDIAIDDVRVNDGPCPQDGNAQPVVVDVTIPPPESEEEIRLSRNERKRRRKMRKIRRKIEASLNRS